jgi:hypothetical protein
MACPTFISHTQKASHQSLLLLTETMILANTHLSIWEPKLEIRDAFNDCTIRYEYYDCVVLATGRSFQGHQLAKSLGHFLIVSPIRSMFGCPSNSKNEQQLLLEGLTPGSHVTAPFGQVSFKTKSARTKTTSTSVQGWRPGWLLCYRKIKMLVGRESPIKAVLGSGIVAFPESLDALAELEATQISRRRYTYLRPSSSAAHLL